MSKHFFKKLLQLDLVREEETKEEPQVYKRSMSLAGQDAEAEFMNKVFGVNKEFRQNI
jgi:hypothetical protein